MKFLRMRPGYGEHLIAEGEGLPGYDPGRERRAEQRARELLKSCENEEEWAMYRDLGFIRVWGGESGVAGEPVLSRDLRGAPYAYPVYPHRPIVAYLPQTGRREAEMVRAFEDVPRTTDRVIFFPRAAGGAR